jgi:CysZ protein
VKRFLQQLTLGYKSYITAIQMVFQHRLYIYFIIPLVLMIGIYFLGDWIVHLQKTPHNNNIRSINDIIWFAFNQHTLDLTGTIIMKSSKYLVVILLSPLFAHVSERIEELLTQNRYPFNLQQTINDVKRGVRIALRNIMWEYFFIVVVIGITVFLDGDLKTALFFSLPLIIGFYYYGFSFLDYINERRRLTIEQSIFFIRKHRGLAISIGSIYSLLFILPLDFHKMMDFTRFYSQPFYEIGEFFLHFIMWLLISFSPVLAIISATIALHETVDLNDNDYAIKKNSSTSFSKNGVVFEDKD